MMLNITHIANTITKTFVQSVILELAKLIINIYVKLMYIMHTHHVFQVICFIFYSQAPGI